MHLAGMHLPRFTRWESDQNADEINIVVGVALRSLLKKNTFSQLPRIWAVWLAEVCAVACTCAVFTAIYFLRLLSPRLFMLRKRGW